MEIFYDGWPDVRVVQGGGLKILYRYLCVGSNPTPVNIMLIYYLSLGFQPLWVISFFFFFFLHLIKYMKNIKYIGTVIAQTSNYSLDNRVYNRKPNIKSLFFCCTTQLLLLRALVPFAFQQHTPVLFPFSFFLLF